MSDTDVINASDIPGVELSTDELRFLALYRKMKHRDFEKLSRANLQLLVNITNEQASLFDEALVIARDATLKDYHVGFLDMEHENDMPEITLSSFEDYASLDELWEDISRKERNKHMKKSNRSSLFNRLSSWLSDAEMVHKRAREVIAKYDETNKLSQQTSKKTQELLANID